MLRLFVFTVFAASCCADSRAQPSCKQTMAEFIASHDAVMRAHTLSRTMKAQFDSRHPKTARATADEALRLLASLPCGSNEGDVVHDANAILGLLALRDGNRTAAVGYLRAAGASSGSPVLDSFGPSLMLAQELAEAGEYDAVANYVISIRRFWTAQDTTVLGLWFPWLQDKDPMTTWVKELKAHKVPDFGINAKLPP